MKFNGPLRAPAGSDSGGATGRETGGTFLRFSSEIPKVGKIVIERWPKINWVCWVYLWTEKLRQIPPPTSIGLFRAGAAAGF